MLLKSVVWIVLWTFFVEQCWCLECFTCSWEESDADEKYLEDKRKKKEDEWSEKQSSEDAIDWPLQSPFLKGNEKILGGELHKYCKTRQGCNYCVRWMLIDNEKTVNVTYLCVRSTNNGITGSFQQHIAGNLKEVYICNGNDKCNGAASLTTYSILLTFTAVCLYLGYV